MASNFFGQIFRITTFGESHGPAIGVVIDGCPAGLPLTEQDIDEQLALRQPGKSIYTSPRNEGDAAEILSGLFEGKTTGAPIAILIRNKDADSSQYASIKDLYRPGHANFTYLEKYGIFDHRGGGRSSARETAARVAAGAVAKKLLAHSHIECVAFVAEIGGIAIQSPDLSHLQKLREKTYSSPIFCPDEKAAQKMMEKISAVKEEKDSLGGILACVAKVPVGFGDPVYGKLEALLAFAMLSLPATKGFEIGSGFQAARMRGSEHNDAFALDEQGHVHTVTNFAGGTLGGISTGSPIVFRVAFKPPSSIKKPQQTVSLAGERATFQLPESGRHDPCVAIRAVPIVEAMTALVLADALLMNRVARI
ncbi:MAG TPA: chorismate synthase [Chlamydiales bacterium]|jgi:chorismate synthase|nr:chorismate synthase [Chlamydiales bacterium]